MKRYIQIISTIVLIISGCKGNKNEVSTLGNASYLKEENLNICDVPEMIQEYLKQSDRAWFVLDDSFFNFQGEQIKCPMSAYGDFNRDSKMDLALIVKSKELPNQNSPAELLILEDYKSEKINLRKIKKTGAYANSSKASVIYDQGDQGVWSYLKAVTQDGNDLIHIVTPEKSTFVIEWDSETKDYLYWNVLDKIGPSIKTNTLGRALSFTPIKGSYSSNFEMEIAYLNSTNDGEKNARQIIILLRNKVTSTVQKIKFTPAFLLSENLPETAVNFSSGDKGFRNGVEEYHKIIFGDFNFDNLEDFAFINYEGSNSGPAYSYFLQNDEGFFEEDEFLTNKMRFFPKSADRTKKNLTTKIMIGCCKVRTDVFSLSQETWTKTSSQEQKI